MTISITSLIPRVRLLLEDAPWEDYISADIVSSSYTQATVNQPSGWTEGDWLEFQDNGDIALVRQGGTTPMTVKGGHFGTTATTHTQNTVVTKNPVWKYTQINEALTRIVDELWPRAWKVATVSLTPSASTTWYDVGATFEDIISVQQVTTGSVSDAISYGEDPGFSFFTRRNMPTSLVPSGNGITFPNSFGNLVNTVLVNYRAKLTTSDITDGLMSEVVIYGAAWRLATGKILKHTGDGITETGKMPPTQTALFLKQTYDENIRLLHRTLQDEIGPMRKWRS